MSASTKNIEDQIKQWEITREKGRSSYVIKNWILPLGLFLPLVMIVITSSINKLPIKAFGVFIVVFEPIFLAATLFAGLYYWKYYEARYDRWNREKNEGPINAVGTRKIFSKYTQLLVGIYSIPIFVVTLLAFFPLLYLNSENGKINHGSAILISFLSIMILSFLPIFNVMVFIKNPICGHAILSNPDYRQRHPNAKGNYWTNAWKILRNRSFICLDCADKFRLIKKDDQLEIEKLDEGKI